MQLRKSYFKCALLFFFVCSTIYFLYPKYEFKDDKTRCNVITGKVEHYGCPYGEKYTGWY